jgi:two-component system sensor histidine kinase YesM
VFLLTVAVPLVLVGVAVTLGYRQFSLQLATSRAAQSVTPLAQSIDEEVRRTSLLTATLSTDPEFVNMVVALNDSRYARQRYEVSASIDARLSRFFNYTNKTGAVLLYLRDGPVFLYRNNGLLFERPLLKTEWYDTVVNTPDATVTMNDLNSYSLSSTQRPLLKVAVCPSRQALARGFEAMVVAFRVPYLDQVAEGDESSGQELLLVDSSKKVILAAAQDLKGTDVDAARLSPGVFRLSGSTYVSSPASIPSADWTLVSITDFSLITRDIVRLARLAEGMLLVLLIAFAIYIQVFFQQVIRPIQSVITEMGRVERGEWNAAVPAEGPAEVAQLGRSFNTMIAEVSRLTAERERQERERARLELEALRLQISPHFLTNTLNSIKMMAGISNAEPIRRMTAALMRVVSSSFRGGGSLATLGEELEILDEYLLIMRVRYGDTFDVHVGVPEDLRGLRVLRMLLQPLVENAILHGLQGLDRRGEIAIRGFLENDGTGAETFHLEVRDNGKGAEPARVEQALAEPPAQHHGMTSIGLANIRSRIVLNHGDRFGLDLRTEPGKGTTVVLTLPAIRGE